MKRTKREGNIILNIVTEKCPNCGKGHVFKQHVSLLNLPIMNDSCEVCHYHYDREPGYFLGAMYISYGLAVLQGVFTFLIAQYAIPQLSPFYKAMLVILVITLCGRKNYKLSRVMYIHIFPW
jgi:uncharacterized protein (DUF983 family)